MNAMDNERRTWPRLTVYVIGAVTMLGVALGIGWLGGVLIGDAPAVAVLAAMAVAAVVSVWLSRLMLCALWWVHAGVWDWRRTSLAGSIRAGWPR